MFKIHMAAILTLSCIQYSCSQGDSNRLIQNSEFVVYENGLIYDKQTMKKLGDVVDSLNLRFKSCEPKSYYSLEQGFATEVVVRRNLAKAVRRSVKIFRSKSLEKNFYARKSHVSIG